jgi:type I restriction enzyme, S subunit
MEASVVNLKKIEEIEDFRIDAECFRPVHLHTENLINHIPHDIIGNLAESVINFGAYSLCNYIEFLPKGMPFIVTEDIDNNIIDTSNLHYISREVHRILYKSHCKAGQVLLTMAGAYLGQAAVYYLGFEASSNQAIAKITLKENSIDPFYLSTFLNCIYGQSQIERFRTGTGQPNLNLGLIQTIKVPLLSGSFQSLINNIILQGVSAHKKGDECYSQAEQILLSELNLLNWKPKHRHSFVKNFSDTQSSERIDAEFYQPMYEKIIEKLTNNFNAKPIGEYDFINITTGQYADEYVLQKEGLPYIRGTDLSNGTVKTESLVYIPKQKQDKSKLAQEGDVVVTRVGTIGLSARIPEECAGGTISDNLIRLRFDNYILNSYYTALYLGSVLGRNLMIRNSRGSVQQRLNQETLKEILLPVLEIQSQKKIATVIIDANQKRTLSKQLLDIAKRGVELAIVKNEKQAQKWIDVELKKMNIV